MKTTQRVRKILSYYETETPGVKANIARFLMEGKLRGTGKSNRDAIGARVFVHLEGRVLRQTLQAGDSFLAQSSKTLHFGLGEAEQIEQVRVVWPDGSEQRVRGVEAGDVLAVHPAQDMAGTIERAVVRSDPLLPPAQVRVNCRHQM